MTMMKLSLPTVAMMSIMTVSSNVSAGDMAGMYGMGAFFDLDDGINAAGLAVGSIPDYSGSDNSEVGVAPVFRYYYSDRKYVEMLGPEVVVNISDDKFFQYGPIGIYRFGREDVDDDIVDRMRDIDDTIELGFFVKNGMQFGEDPRHRLNIYGDVVFDAGGEHDGYLATARISYFTPVAKATVFHIGAATSYASSDFMDTYYSVDATDSALSGLPVYNASSDVRDYRITFGVLQHLSANWHVGVGARYQRLLNDAADSPVVNIRGDEDQWIYGASVMYSWQ
jgi:outer membrane protein